MEYHYLNVGWNMGPFFEWNSPIRSVRPIFGPAHPRSPWRILFRSHKHCQWIGLRENLQENPIFNGKIYGFRFQFSLKPILGSGKVIDGTSVIEECLSTIRVEISHVERSELQVSVAAVEKRGNWSSCYGTSVIISP